MVLLCARCRELVSADFVDVADVMGLGPAEGESCLGVASSARLAIDLVGAHLSLDDLARRGFRMEATGRPGDSVDALAQLAAVLSRMANPHRPLRALQQIALRLEMSALDHDLINGAGRRTEVDT